MTEQTAGTWVESKGASIKKPGRSFMLGCLCGILLVVLGFILVVLAGALFFKDTLAAFSARQLRVPPITSGQKADYDWKIRASDGVEFDFAQVRGQTLFLNFWHPNCVPCLAELGALERLYEAVREENIFFACIVLGEAEELSRDIEARGLLVPVYYAEEGRPEVFHSAVTPVTFIVEPHGGIVFKHENAAQWDDPSAITFLKELSGEGVRPD
jgi:thiol-disulfide isomerase/thioredoxin